MLLHMYKSIRFDEHHVIRGTSVPSYHCVGGNRLLGTRIEGTDPIVTRVHYFMHVKSVIRKTIIWHLFMVKTKAEGFRLFLRGRRRFSWRMGLGNWRRSTLEMVVGEPWTKALKVIIGNWPSHYMTSRHTFPLPVNFGLLPCQHQNSPISRSHCLTSEIVGSRRSKGLLGWGLINWGWIRKQTKKQLRCQAKGADSRCGEPAPKQVIIH